METENKHKAAYLGFGVKTADGYLIVDKMAVWDYNLRPGYVNLDTLDSTGWFNIVDRDGNRMSMMNAERICVRHPSSHDAAEDVLNERQEKLNDEIFKTEIEDI